MAVHTAKDRENRDVRLMGRVLACPPINEVSFTYTVPVVPAVSYWSATSRHRSKNAGDHALALGPDFEVIDQFLKFSENYTHRLPGLIGEMLSRSISQVLAEASSIGYCLNLTSECDRQLLRDMILKLIETQTSAKLHNIIHLNQDKRVAKPYKELLSKMLALATEQKNPIQQRQIAKPLCGNHPDTPKLLNDIDHRVQELEAYLKAKPRKPANLHFADYYTTLNLTHFHLYSIRHLFTLKTSSTPQDSGHVETTTSIFRLKTSSTLVLHVNKHTHFKSTWNKVSAYEFSLSFHFKSPKTALKTDSCPQTPAAMEENDPYNPKLTYLGDYADLPIDAPVGHPHLVDPDSVDEEFTQEDLTVADLVVTILFKFMPEALTAFLDLNRPKVHYIQGGSSCRLDFCIKRNNRLVTIGFLNEKALGGWDLQYQYRIKGKATEMWTPVSMSPGVGHKVIGAEKIVQGAPGIAFSIFQHEPWKPAQEMEWVNGLSHGRKF
ncbi:MAG: hypothetical protein ASARMPRED_000348 [Alectoria sarmentosa]|nr:MAG: hypothetical protein ASARMPRED_000348 [Alectoria sarmentosa]